MSVKFLAPVKEKSTEVGTAAILKVDMDMLVSLTEQTLNRRTSMPDANWRKELAELSLCKSLADTAKRGLTAESAHGHFVIERVDHISSTIAPYLFVFTIHDDGTMSIGADTAENPIGRISVDSFFWHVYITTHTQVPNNLCMYIAR